MSDVSRLDGLEQVRSINMLTSTQYKRRKVDEQNIHEQQQDEKILEYIKNAQVEDLKPEQYDLEWLENLSKQLKLAIKENSSVHSEVHLNELIKQISNITLAELPLYNDFIRLNQDSFQELISHPNHDIINQFIKVFNDLIDSEYEDDQSELLKYLSQHQIINFLSNYLSEISSTVTTLDQQQQQQLQDIQDVQITILTIFNELTNYEDTNLKNDLIKQDDFIQFLINTIRQVRKIDEITYYRELINDYLYKLSSWDPIRFISKHGFYIEVMLIQLSFFTNQEPEDGSTQENFIETGIQILSNLVSNKSGRELFLTNEGFELLLILIKNGDWGFKTFIKISNYLIESINDSNNVDLSSLIIDSNYFLNHVFKNLNKFKNDRDVIYQILKILVKLIIFLPFNSDQRIRLINKLINKNYKSLNVILKIETKYDQNVSKLDIKASESNDTVYSFDELYIDKIENGLDILQQISIFKSWLLIEDDKLKNDMIHMKYFNLDKLRNILTGYKDELKFNIENTTNQDLKNEFFEYTTMINELLANLYT
ncbi:Beta-catenin-like protein 1 [Wickerhamomyces ciferrii]|uniref:Beta-catenin-like protein 1 n=1 Tax=Wickerhamomyces ciferrii (strain ATCC 14091 / BCRC 22168 / CBS 111 / JCM 3599 / NBRC 0793 / NRRL Y-1031 F-60-10) TaxID=1206466 RepID=K0KJA3_WICCF|nr:Beta-catenin-like protein 1 [Wickerhamomyces ciferrii]CCH41569.1 Beta-catenin-like protein 1 [Wickerhamomyces ciferrii]